jgi:beta-xylosidase
MTPLLELKENTFAMALDTNSEWRREMTLRIFNDRVECVRPGAVTRGTTDTIRYEQIAQVMVDRRTIWSSLIVETNGGGGFTIRGLRKDPADKAKALIDERVARVREHSTQVVGVPTSLAHEISNLAALHQSGALTSDEFPAAKKQLLEN